MHVNKVGTGIIFLTQQYAFIQGTSITEHVLCVNYFLRLLGLYEKTKPNSCFHEVCIYL